MYKYKYVYVIWEFKDEYKDAKPILIYPEEQNNLKTLIKASKMFNELTKETDYPLNKQEITLLMLTKCKILKDEIKSYDLKEHKFIKDTERYERKKSKILNGRNDQRRTQTC